MLLFIFIAVMDNGVKHRHQKTKVNSLHLYNIAVGCAQRKRKIAAK